MVSKIAVLTGGLLMLSLGVFHSRFYSLFQWQEDLKRLTRRNYRIFLTIHLALTLLLVFMGFLTILFYRELSVPKGLAMGFDISMVLFWLWRMIWQAIYFKIRINARSILLTGWFFLLTITYLIPILVRFF